MKWMSRFGFRAYLALSYTLLVLIGMTLIGIFWFREQETAAENSLLVQLKAQARLFSILPEIVKQPDVALNMPGPMTAFNTNLKVVYINTANQIQRVSDLDLTDSERSVVLDMAPKVMGGAAVTQEIPRTGRDSSDVLYAAAPVYDANSQVTGAICLVLSLDNFRASMAQMRWQAVAFMAALAIITLLLGLSLAEVFTHPLAEASQMSARIAGGDTTARLQRSGPRELANLADNFNHMAQELDRQSKLRIEVLANVTHEVARPIGALQLGVDSLLKGGIDDREFARDLLEDMNCTLQSLDALAEDLAVAARPSNVPFNLDLKHLEVYPYLSRLFSRFRPRAENQNIHLSLDAPRDLPAMVADEERMNQILGNLLDNSLKFTRPGGEVRISASREDPWIEIAVQDTGPGIPPDQVANIFTPFVRGTNVHQISDGMGLGLSIARQLVEAHHGKIELHNLPEGGLVAVILIPADSGGGAVTDFTSYSHPYLTDI
jgi:signal transduction histidine kinase